MIRIGSVSILAIMLISAACSRTDKAPGTPSSARVPDSILEKAKIILTSAGKRQAVITADTLFVYDKEDSTIAKNVKVDFYNDNGEYQSTLTSKEGLVRQKKQAFSVWGDVVVENDTARLDTQSLNWDPEKNLITTQDYVKLNRNGDIITGYGMEADNRLSDVRILSNVSGKIKEVPQSEQALDSLERGKSKEEIP